MKYTEQTQTHTYIQTPSENQIINSPHQINFVLHLQFSFET